MIPSAADGPAAGPTAGTASVPALTLPSRALQKGGGAIRGLGEAFTANPATGAASFAVPIALSPGRSGFGPALTLGYDTGRGNGPFGLGWDLGVPAVTRRTDRMLPTYLDEVESDVFVLSAAEDLVPERNADGSRVSVLDPDHAPGYRIDGYRPRVEAGFARIERWTRTADGDTHWRSITGANVTHVFGADPTARITDPADHGRVFSWLISSSHDDRGNAIRYEYKSDDDAGVDLGAPGERNRGAAARRTNRHLKRIRYGNRVSRLVDPAPAAPDWAFEVVIDYGEHDDAAPTPAEDRPWTCRLDPFSSYRAGFEIRAQRLVRRILMFHHFPDEPDVGAACLVSSTAFGYDGDPRRGDRIVTLLTSVVRTGHRRTADGYDSRSLPPVELDYQQALPVGEVRDVEQSTLAGLPGADGHWVDLDGDGLAGVLTEEAAHWLYQRNLGSGRFAAPQPLPTVPAARELGSGRQQLLDLAGDGHLDVVALDGAVPGFHERTEDGGWAPFVPFAALPSVDVADPNLRWIDLNGDGRADILVTEGDTLRWHPALGRTGFGPARSTPTGIDEERGPRLVLADGTDSVHLADMSGDGLTDLVRVRNGEACYWPNLGHGRFGAKVTMAGAPRFDSAAAFDPALVRLADVDGTGATDLVYLGGGVTIWPNHAGNGFGPPQRVDSFPVVDDHSSVAVVDLLGTGTACLVWSSPLPEPAGRHVRYLDLTGGVKPYLLAGCRNNLGAETRIEYATSTTFFLADRAAGQPWSTRLPFPVHVVTRVETIDHVGRNRYVRRYTYHHGHYDGVEREFRGFGRVEQTDAETIGTLTDPAAGSADPATTAPPVLTRTWYHTGRFDPAGRVSRHHEDEYWAGDPGFLLADAALPAGLADAEAREACRALRGLPLRTEVYALDGTAVASLPYTVTEQNAAVRLVQPGSEAHAVVFTHPRESVTLHYERRPVPDPRISHTVTLDVDAFGNVLRSVAIAYGRRHPDPGLTPDDQAVQARPLATATDREYTAPVTTPTAHRTPLPAEHRTFELVNLPRPATRLLTVGEIADALATASDGTNDVPPEDLDASAATPGTPARRLLGHERIRYRRDDLTGALPHGQSGSLALPFETYRLALTPGVVTAAYGSRVTDSLLLEAGYVTEPGGGWWAPSGRAFHTVADVPAAEELAHAQRHFFLPARVVDPFGAAATVTHDRYDLFPVLAVDPLGNRTEVECDYRVLAPRRLTDPNGNRTEVAFDLLGLVTGTARAGKTGEQVGDTLAGFVPDLTDEQIAADLADPLAEPHALLASASTRMIYDLSAYRRTRDQPQPQGPVVHTLTRETHATDLAPGQRTRIQHDLTYSDGFGRVVQTKAPAPPGPLTEDGPVAAARWVGSGWTVFNTKGSPVRRYEPFFTTSHRFESGRAIGVSPVICYDPVQRVVATLHPDHTWTKAVADPWREETWDAGDAVLLDPAADPDLRRFALLLPATDWSPTWHAARIGGALGAAERDAATKAAVHAATPGVSHVDALGRPFRTLTHNRDPHTLTDEHLVDRVRLDIEGRTREASDARGRVIARHLHGIGGARLRSTGLDTGERRVLPDVVGTPLCSWDDRGHRHRTVADALRRPVELLLQAGTSAELVVGRTVYGEALPDAAARNLRTVAHQTFDPAGVSTVERRDFKGNVLAADRRFTHSYRTTVDWGSAPALEAETFATATRYDALDRPVQLVAPHSGALCDVLQFDHDERGAVVRVDVWSRREAPAAHLDPATADLHAVTAVEHDAEGRRIRIAYGNGAVTRHSYDPATSRLRRLVTTRSAGTVQDLHYTYDPVGNVTTVADAAQQTTFFANQVVEPGAGYTYDALHRLVEATGREHLGGTSTGPTDAPHLALPHPGDGAAMGRYTERYHYDQVGNLLELAHQATQPGGSWTRRHTYAEPGRLAPGQAGNRLSTTRVGDGPELTYQHDEHGNMTVLPHLPSTVWDHADRLRAVARQVVDDGTPETTYYVYDAAGDRVRAVTDRSAPAGTTPGRSRERRYLGGFEINREYAGDGTTVVLERETLHVPDGGRRIALVETRTRGTDPGSAHLVRFSLGDHLDSSALELDATGSVISYEEYHPYGSTSYQAVRSQTETPKRYRFTGRERDTETGFAYHGARYYAPWLGRWTAPDPAGLVDGPCLYCYSRANPVRWSDPTGTTARQPDPVPGSARTVPSAALPVSSGLQPTGPPYSAEEVEQRRVLENAMVIQTAADVLLAREDEGSIALGTETFDKNGYPKDNDLSRQLYAVATASPYGKLPKFLTIDNARVLQRIVEKARERREAGLVDGVDTRIVSLWRPDASPTSPHRAGAAVDIGKYAGQSILNSTPTEAAMGTLQFYEDLLGGDTMPAVDTGIALGLLRQPHVGAEAAAEFRSEQKRRAYGIANGAAEGDLHSQGDLVLKPSYTYPSMFFKLNTAPNNMPADTVKNAMKMMVDPWVRQRFLELYAKDQGRVLRYLMPDGWDHFHSEGGRRHSGP